MKPPKLADLGIVFLFVIVFVVAKVHVDAQNPPAAPPPAPAAEIAPAEKKPVDVAAPEVVRLKVENLQLQAQVLQQALEASEPMRAYRAGMAQLAKQLTAVQADFEKTHPGKTLDLVKKTVIDKPKDAKGQ